MSRMSTAWFDLFHPGRRILFLLRVGSTRANSAVPTRHADSRLVDRLSIAVSGRGATARRRRVFAKLAPTLRKPGGNFTQRGRPLFRDRACACYVCAATRANGTAAAELTVRATTRV